MYNSFNFILIIDYEGIKDVLGKLRKDLDVLNEEVSRKTKIKDGGKAYFQNSLEYLTFCEIHIIDILTNDTDSWFSKRL